MALAASSACGGDSDAGPTPRRADLPSPSHSGTVIDMVARDRTFSRQEMTFHTEEQTSIILTNMDAVPHNLSIYRTEDAIEEVFVGETITGPDETTEYYFVAPERTGEYFFRCDVHPTQMTGKVIVRR
jgi:plastocyanin